MNLNMKPMAYVIIAIMAFITFGYMHSASANTLTGNDVNSAGFGELSDVDKALIIKEVADKAAAAKKGVGTISTDSAEQAQKWIDISTGMGRGIINLVKELGVTVNEFIRTPAGLLTIGLLAFHVMGKALVHVAAGTIIPLVMIPIWIWSYRKLCVYKSATVERTGFFKYKKTFEFHRADDGDVMGYRIVHWVMLAILCAVDMVVLFNW